MKNDWEPLRDVGPQIEEREHRHKKSTTGKKPFIIEKRYKGTMPWLGEMWAWRVDRRYKTEQQRDKALSNLRSKKDSNWEYR